MPGESLNKLIREFLIGELRLLAVGITWICNFAGLLNAALLEMPTERERGGGRFGVPEAPGPVSKSKTPSA